MTVSIEEFDPEAAGRLLSSALERFRPRVPGWTPFHEPSHLALWLERLGGPGTGRVVAAWDGSGELAAYAPFLAVPARVGPLHVPTLRFIGNNVGSPGDILRGEVFATPPRASATEAILSHVAAEWPFRRWELGYVPTASDTVHAVSRILNGGGDAGPHAPMPFVSVDLPPDWDAYLASLSGNVRSTYRRCLRHLDRRGEVRIVLEASPETARDRVGELIRNHDRWHAGTARERWLGDDAVRRFLADSAELLARQGRYIAATLELDRTPIAWVVGPVHAGTYFEHIGSFDRAHADLSPGVVLALELIRELISRGVRRIDLGPGASPFKRGLGGSERPYVRVEGFRGWLRGAASVRQRLRRRRAP